MSEDVSADLEDCPVAKDDAKKFAKMALIFSNPVTLSVHIGRDILFNGSKITTEMQAAYMAWYSAQFEEFGINMGKAMAQFWFGGEQAEALPESIEDDPKEHHRKRGHNGDKKHGDKKHKEKKDKKHGDKKEHHKKEKMGKHGDKREHHESIPEDAERFIF